MLKLLNTSQHLLTTPFKNKRGLDLTIGYCYSIATDFGDDEKEIELTIRITNDELAAIIALLASELAANLDGLPGTDD